MLATKWDETGVSVHYDGCEFFIMPLEGNNFQVTCKRLNRWNYYEPRVFHSFAEICEAIFFGTILVNRTECGHFVYDERGNIIDLVPLSYYELAA